MAWSSVEASVRTAICTNSTNNQTKNVWRHVEQNNYDKKFNIARNASQAVLHVDSWALSVSVILASILALV